MSSDKKSWKSDKIRESEIEMQQYWEKHGLNLSSMKSRNSETNKKFFGTFPYPYMNGYLHLGHGFTMSTVDFTCRYKNMLGYNVLQPFSFHLTGMPIMAAADKLKEDFKIIDSLSSDTLKINSLAENSQYNIMIKMGIPNEMVRNFVDPTYWGEFFSQAAKKTLNRFGYSYDPRRSFITTDANPYYDQFVKWQFHKLYCKNVLKFGTRYDIFSVKDNQPCLGHERSSGEDAVPLREYLIPFLITNKYCKENASADKVYIIATTQRPETLYGMTNLWINKYDTYGVFNVYKTHNSITSTEKWICKEYNLISLLHQTRETDPFHLISYDKLGDAKGEDFSSDYFYGCKAINPFNNEEYPIIGLNYDHIDPSLKIEPNKGSGIVISVPSEYPIDYLGYIDADVEYEYKKKIKSIIKITHSEYSGCMMAPDFIDKVKQIKPSNFDIDIYIVPVKDMNTINEFCCTGSATSGTMICEPYIGMTTTEARSRIYSDNLDKIIMYYEPDRETLSRSDDRLIVAKLDQWFIDYSEPSWKEKAHTHINTMQFNEESIRNSLRIAIDWLDQWPCSRTYGLGTMFPEEIVGKGTKHMIDSLSDSTIYMAFYTIYHMFNELNIDSEELTYDVFDYIFLLKDYDNEKFSKFKPLREEFLHWYPVDLRVSAKDLVNNHLAMCIFTHVLIWDDEFMNRLKLYCPNHIKKTFGPMRYDINGYIAVQKANKKDIEKMSKSKGNFKTLDQAINQFSADAIRFTFASSVTGTDDAYFDQDLCNRMIEKLHKEKLWISEKLLQLKSGFYTHTEINLHDRVFMNEISLIIRDTLKSYEKLDFRNVTTLGFHGLQSLRDVYRDMVGDNMNPNIIKLFIRAQLTLMYPIIPHFCDYFNISSLFKEIFYSSTSDIDNTTNSTKIQRYHIFTEDFDKEINQEIRWMHKYLSALGSDIAKRVLGLNKKRKSCDKVKKVSIYVAVDITDMYEQIAYKIYRQRTDKAESYIMTSNEIIEAAKELDSEMISTGNDINIIIRSYKHIEALITDYGGEWLEKRLLNSISEADVINENLKYYLKKNPSDNYSVQVLVYDPLIHKDNISGVRINNPVIKYF